MLSLVRSTPALNDSNTEVELSFNQQKRRWEQHMQQGYRCHNKKQHKQALMHFKASQEASWELISNQPEAASYKHNERQGERWEMLFNASHNLAASYNAIGDNHNSTKLLTELHQYLIYIISNSSKPRHAT